MPEVLLALRSPLCGQEVPIKGDTATSSSVPLRHLCLGSLVLSPEQDRLDVMHSSSLYAYYMLGTVLGTRQSGAETWLARKAPGHTRTKDIS